MNDRPKDRQEIDEGTGEDPNQLRKEELEKNVEYWLGRYEFSTKAYPGIKKENLEISLDCCLKNIYTSKYNYATAEIWEEISEQFGCKECGEFLTQYFMEGI